MPVTERRAARKREILEATRSLFDERGVRDAQIEDIARAVGINRAIIYRHFSGKEELFAQTLVGYLRGSTRPWRRPTTRPPTQKSG
ncbi:helix-turn-helix domain-containing protein [Aeromicrobium sp. UC242_57]|uniref:helix-turn-helix domain-containing protein n=1 Tax=Aeromicrobium sp. UC242_57 TaxID=3374624 RepID=UPI00379E35AE